MPVPLRGRLGESARIFNDLCRSCSALRGPSRRSALLEPTHRCAGGKSHGADIVSPQGAQPRRTRRPSSCSDCTAGLETLYRRPRRSWVALSNVSAAPMFCRPAGDHPSPGGRSQPSEVLVRASGAPLARPPSRSSAAPVLHKKFVRLHKSL